MVKIKKNNCNKKISFILFFSIILFSSYLFAQGDDSSYVATKDDINFHLTLQLMGSGDYAAGLGKMGATGYLHWLAFDVGFGFRIKDNLFLAPRLNVLTSRVTYGSQYSYGGENAKITVVIIPGVTGRYYFKDIGALYALASVGIIASVSSEVMDGNFESNGIALGCGAGYEFAFGSRSLVLEFGYCSVPIKQSAIFNYGFYSGSFSTDENWGGIFFTVGTSFNITNY
jgi:hypothetical protein